MCISPRYVFPPLTLVAVCTGLALSNPRFRESNLKFWGGRTDAAAVREEHTKAEELNDLTLLTRKISSLKRGVAAEFTAGRITAAEAVDQFVELNRADPHLLAAELRNYPGANEREVAARHVLHHISTRPEASADDGRAELLALAGQVR
jgi:hypothetical protein